MRLDKEIILALLLFLTLATLNCKDPQNTNKQNASQTPTRSPAHWIAQWQSPQSRDTTGINLAAYAYSSISVVSSDVVFVAGEMPNPKDKRTRIGVVINTTNGGQTWNETLIDQIPDKDTALNSIHFVNPRVGWMVGAISVTEDRPEGVMFKTTDAGASWAVSKLPYKQVPTCIFFVDEMTGWMGGVTLDTGEAGLEPSKTPGKKETSGKQGTPGKNQLPGSTPASPDGDASDGGPSDILTTTDGGRTWQSQWHISTSITDIYFVDRNTGWAVGYKGAIYNTTDGGRGWKTQKSELEFNEHYTDPKNDDSKNFIVSGVHFFDEKNGLAAAAASEEDLGRIVGTSNGGETWARKLIAQGEGIRDVFLLTPAEGWATPRFPKYIYHTIDGGRYWEGENIIFPQEVPFFRIAGADASHIWAVGGGAIFFRVP
ncbi:MAG TPA: hypothetical protein VGV87_29360 [Blastocatellia bacterium]|jgi:photosystem II stability/assembly factor-like uncharacterized protein|nr:hypothetical protein [Blastocatellia bacterium]